MRLATANFWFLLLLTAGYAQAKSPAPSPQSAPTAAPSETEVASSTGNASQKPVTAASPTNSQLGANEQVCGLGVYDGIQLADANTAAGLVCDALREQRAPMAPAWGDTSLPIYRVEVRRLGTHVMLGVTEELPPGTKIRSRTLELASVEEAVQGAPRLAEATIKDIPVSKTVQANNQTTPETVARPKRAGYAQFEPGVVAIWAPGARGGGYGIDLGFSWQGERAAAGLDLRFAGGGVGEAAIVVNGHYALTDGDTAPIIGGGLGVMGLWVNTNDTLKYDLGGYADTATNVTYSGSGPFLELIAGVETLRTTKTRLNALLTVDIPTFGVDYRDRHSRYAPVVGIGAHALF
jgi:hypothetical protein